MDIFELFKKIEKPQNAGGQITHIVVGLGNPGAEYEATRHNAGYLAIDALAREMGVTVNRARFKSLTAECEIAGHRVLLMKPETYMNNSGEAVGEAARFYKIAPENIIVLCDEISFAPGKMRIRRRGSAGGHNGLKSIIAHLSSEDFPRFKLGVGQKPSPDYDLAAWVLSRFGKEEGEALAALYPSICEAVRLVILGNIDEAMNKYSK